MSHPKTINIQLSPEDSDRLETAARQRNLTSDTLASLLLHECLTQVKQPANPREILLQLRAIGRKMSPTDAVQLAQESRRDIEQRGVL
jgi:hypothetical protein